MSSSAVTRLQGVYYLLSGLFPIISFRAFEALTGRKRDRWLVRTVGLLAAVIGLTLIRRPGRSRELADLSAGAFAVADLLAVRAGQLPTYIADAFVEGAFVAGRRVGT
jgi:uncharacterized membrane protein HdeD (DUF308 family)